MARELKGWEIVNPKVDYIDDQKQSLKSVLKDCGYNANDRFINNCVDRVKRTKEEIINGLGGVEIYSIMEMDLEQRDDEQLAKFASSLAKMQELSWGYMADNNYNHAQISNCLNDYEVLCHVMSLNGDERKISKLKEYFNELEFVSRLRTTLPKETKVVSNILTHIVKKHNLDSSIEKLAPSVIDTLGSTKKKQYIVIISTAPSAIYTASVSKYFDSCYDIRDRGHCYASSVSYLALDKQTAIMKIFELNDENLNLLNTGGIGALSSTRQALARRFVFFKKDSEEKETLVILGKAYPNEMQLEGSFFSKEIYKLYTKDNTSDLDSYPLFDHKYYNKISYSNWFTGYKDLVEKGGMIAHKSTFEPKDIYDKFDNLKIAYNGICTIDTGDFIAYSFSGSNIGIFPFGRDDDYDPDEFDETDDGEW